MKMRAAGVLAVFALAAGVLLTTGPVHAITIGINPSLTFLRTSRDPAGPSIPIELASLGLSAGDIIRLEQLGDFAPHGTGPADDTATSMIGVFSASATLLGSSTLNRVQDALDAGVDVVTVPTSFGGVTTDIPEDFLITDIIIQIPLMATHLFVAPHDSFYGDNTDPDGDYAVRITVVPEPGTLLLLSSGLAALGGVAWRRDRRRRANL